MRISKLKFRFFVSFIWIESFLGKFTLSCLFRLIFWEETIAGNVVIDMARGMIM